MPQKLNHTPSLLQRVIASTLAVGAGIWFLLRVGKDFQYIKFEPHTPEEVERRKREHEGLSIKYLDTRTLEYTPEAKQRLEKMIEAKSRESDDSDK
ncbi:uncharacterized protein PRCAT00006053001 [Priceomyces carsonii]|uniref:uncharacterized protein n=1 Tax=Priceomyces carsonii TaxID=28549 RepID=UPI002ED93616|nr:unnamed protein product [Priceomyces carsonii]